MKDSQNDLLECIKLREIVLGRRHLQTIESKFELATSYARGSKAEQEEAARLYENCLRQRRAMLGAEHPETLLALYCQAYVYEMLDRKHQAGKCFDELKEKGVDLRSMILSPHHTAFFANMDKLQVLAKATGLNNVSVAIADNAYPHVERSRGDIEW